MLTGGGWRAGCLALAVVVLVAAVLGVFLYLRNQGVAPPAPGQERCVATAGGSSVALGLEQAQLTSVVVGLSVRRGLPPRAASIAMATVYQETGIRNLDYGDRDSVGLFQQRPSQGWGTEKQLQDPYYATGKFYDALVRIDNWQARDITEVAQLVQRSGYPEAYRDHEADARVLASVLTGQSPSGMTCLDRSETPGNTAALAAGLKRTYGSTGVRRAGKVVTVKAKSATLAWAYAAYAVANARAYGLVSADVGGRRWEAQTLNLPAWTSATISAGNASGRSVTLTVR